MLLFPTPPPRLDQVTACTPVTCHFPSYHELGLRKACVVLIILSRLVAVSFMDLFCFYHCVLSICGGIIHQIDT